MLAKIEFEELLREAINIILRPKLESTFKCNFPAIVGLCLVV